MPVVEADHLYKVFGRRSREAVTRLAAGESTEDVRRSGVTPAVVDASFTVEEGEIFVVMGLSGSGKSTLIRMLNGLHEPTSGHVEIHGENITAASRRDLRRIRRERVSMVFQHFALFPHRSVLDNAAYGLEMQGVGKNERRQKAHEALEMCGLSGWDKHLPGELSGGMRQRVGLARALAAETDVLLMDEAFSALDPLIRREMQDQLIDLQHKLGRTIVFITHDLNEAMRLGDRIAMMRSGRIVQIGTAEEILTAPANDYVAQFIAEVDRSRVLTASSVMEQPTALLEHDQTPRTAEPMIGSQPGLYVVDGDHKLLGYLTDQDVRTNLDRQSFGGIMRKAPTTVAPTTPLADLFGPASGNPLPLPVLDDDGKLLGVIPRERLLAALGEQHQSQEAAHA